MCFGGLEEFAAGGPEACDNATNAYLRLKYKKPSSWLSSKVHRIKRMVGPVVELLQRGHRTTESGHGNVDKVFQVVTAPHEDSWAEEMDNDANEALESNLPCLRCCCRGPCCRPCCGAPLPWGAVLVTPVWEADSDVCYRSEGMTLTSSQVAEQQSPCYAF